LKELLYKSCLAEVEPSARAKCNNFSHRYIHPGPYVILSPYAIDPLYHRGVGQCPVTVFQGKGKPPPATKTQLLQPLKMKTVLIEEMTFQALQGMVMHLLISKCFANGSHIGDAPSNL
jgi:hypothetical protein